MHNNRRRRLLAHTAHSICIAVALGACGGGGGGSGGGNTVPPNPTPPPNQPPQASFTISDTSGPAPLTITADASGSSDPDGEISTYTWDFDDTNAIGVVAQHTFTDPGSFTITLAVVDNDGAQTMTSRSITVETAVTTATVSGTVKILNSSAVDGDVNDRNTTVVSNNSFAEAQPLPSPVILGGFANMPGTGEQTGLLGVSGDPGDYYQVSLAGAEVIVLTIAEADADLDLRLWDAGQSLVDGSIGTGGTETLQVATGGTYYVEVFPVSGASNYVLAIGQDPSAATTPRPPTRLSDPFIAGELIVKPRRYGPRASARKIRTRRFHLNAQHNLHPHSTSPGLFNIAEGIGMTDVSSIIPPDGLVTADQIRRIRTLNALKELKQDPHLAHAEPNMLVHSFATPDDTFFGSQWHYPAVNLPLAWDITTGTSEVIVAVVDTGVLLAHPDLAGKTVPGYDFISDAERALDGDGIDDNPNDPGDRNFGGSSSFHGTHVAGTVGAVSNNSTGVSGVAWNTRIMPLRALGKDGGSTFDVVQAVRFAAGLSNNSGTVPAQRADIINLSLGSTFSSQSEQDTYTEAIQAGVLIVAAAGNDSASLPSYPAAYDGVVSVSATTITNEAASYSNFGATIDVAAPGGSNISDLNGDGIVDGVISTMGDDSGSVIEFGYAALSGTSMAAPHVAGVAALMKAVHPTMTPAEFNSALLAGEISDDLGDAGRDDLFGHGLINAHKAVTAAELMAGGQGTDPGPVLSASASTLNLGAFVNRLALNLVNAGTGSIQVNSVTSSEPWLSVTAPGSSDGLGEYQLNVDRTGLAEGTYQANLDIQSDTNDVTVSVIMQVLNANLTADAGLHYMVLVDSEGDTVEQFVTPVVDGEYPFTFSDVPAGQYRLFTGTDADDDSLLCDAGEACGAYPTLDSPEFLSINADLSGLELESSYRVNLTPDAQAASTRQNPNGIPLRKTVPE